MEHYDIIKSLLHTEKSANLYEPAGAYAFWVDRRANKIEIRRAIEALYNVKVKSVRTQIVTGKAKRLRHQLGYTSDWKRAIVGLREGEKIEEKWR
ncbi:MAG: 50S ribosomal protein L23 [Candidatus Omnitrophota bacterium]